MEAKERKYQVFRLLPDDRKLLAELPKTLEETDRHAALERLAEIIPGLYMKDIRGLERKPLRLGIPLKTDAAIRQKMEETGQTYTDILLAAASKAAHDAELSAMRKAKEKIRRKFLG